MPSRRDEIAMTPDEVRAYLRGETRLIVVSNGPGGFPHPVPMNFALDDEGRLLIISFRKSQKIKNLERDPRAALLVESGRAYADLKAVMIYATAELIADPEEVVRLKRHFAGKAQTAELSGPAMAQAQAALTKRIIVRFTPQRTISWDHAKLAGRY